MKTFKELREEAWELATSRWLLRLVAVCCFLGAIALAVLIPLVWFYEANDIQTWGAFMETQARMKQSGLDVTVASSQQFWSMTWASGFQTFLEDLLQGIMMFGITTFVLTKAARNDDKDWFACAFGGFRIPLETLWLILLMLIRIALWTLLFIIPGIIAMFRYSMAWFVKVEHPEYSAGQCLAESGRLMNGHKFDFFCFCLSYFGWLLLAVFTLMIGASLARESSLTGGMLLLAGFALTVFVMAYIEFGKTRFYIELKRISGNKTDNPAAVDNSATVVES